MKSADITEVITIYPEGNPTHTHMCKWVCFLAVLPIIAKTFHLKPQIWLYKKSPAITNITWIHLLEDHECLPVVQIQYFSLEQSNGLTEQCSIHNMAKNLLCDWQAACSCSNLALMHCGWIYLFIYFFSFLAFIRRLQSNNWLTWNKRREREEG